jgi:hypothetical protein
MRIDCAGDIGSLPALKLRFLLRSDGVVLHFIFGCVLSIRNEHACTDNSFGARFTCLSLDPLFLWSAIGTTAPRSRQRLTSRQGALQLS